MELKYKEPFFTFGLIKTSLPYYKFKARLIWKILFGYPHRIGLSMLIEGLQRKGEL